MSKSHKPHAFFKFIVFVLNIPQTDSMEASSDLYEKFSASSFHRGLGPPLVCYLSVCVLACTFLGRLGGREMPNVEKQWKTTEKVHGCRGGSAKGWCDIRECCEMEEDDAQWRLVMISPCLLVQAPLQTQPSLLWS